MRLVTLLAVTAVLAAGAAPMTWAAEPPPLWLRPAEAGAGNFTTSGPTNASAVETRPLVSTALSAEWMWTMAHVPEPLTLASGTEVVLILHMRGLAGVVPFPDVNDPAGSLGQVTVRANLLQGSNEAVVATGVARVPAEPNGDAGQVHELTFVLPLAADTTWQTDPGNRLWFGVGIEVEGVMDSDAPLVILVAGTDAPSRLLVPGFPVAAFAAWEAADRARARCNERVLQGLPCEEPAAPEPTSEPGEASGVGLSMVLVGVALLAVARRQQSMRSSNLAPGVPSLPRMSGP